MIWLGLGGNVGDVVSTLASARADLAAQSPTPLVISPCYTSAPWGGVPQGAYVNQVVGMTFSGAPEALLTTLQNIERAHGRDRERETRWGPRTLDLDLLSWPGHTCETPRLTLPHPRLAERRFVLRPWADVAPEVVPFGLDRTVAELLASCADSGWVRRC